MTKDDYEIHMRSLRACLEHLLTIDLTDMAVSAVQHGTTQDRLLIRRVSQFLPYLPGEDLHSD